MKLVVVDEYGLLSAFDVPNWRLSLQQKSGRRRVPPDFHVHVVMFLPNKGFWDRRFVAGANDMVCKVVVFVDISIVFPEIFGASKVQNPMPSCLYVSIMLHVCMFSRLLVHMIQCT